MDKLDSIAKQARKDLTARDKAREKMLPLCRDTIRYCSNAIRAVHRREFDKAEGLYQSAGKTLTKARTAVESNNELISSTECHLRLTRKGNLFGMHYSLDGTKWRFVRAFGFELPEKIMVGIHVQAPSTSGCRALYRSFIYTAQPVENFRSGD